MVKTLDSCLSILLIETINKEFSNGIKGESSSCDNCDACYGSCDTCDGSGCDSGDSCYDSCYDIN